MPSEEHPDAARPSRFSCAVVAEFMETLEFEGYQRTGADLFTDRKTALRPLVFHVFEYDHDGDRYGVRVADRDREKTFVAGDRASLHVDPDNPRSCWFMGAEMKNYVYGPEDEGGEDDA